MSENEKSDAQLVKLVLNGSAEFFSELVERYEKLVFSFLLARFNDPCEVEDIVQDAFLKAYKHLASFDCERKFSTWLLTVARNILIDRKRKASRSIAASDVLESETLFLDKSEGSSPAAQALKREAFRATARAVNALPEEIKAPFLLRVVNELSYQEIADALDIPLQTVKNRIFKARTIMRDKKETL